MHKNTKERILIFIILLIVTVFCSVLTNHFFDLKVNDFFIKTVTNVLNKKSSDDVVLVVIDNKSVSQIAWPWQRDLFSDLFDFLEKEGGAKAILFNNLILYPDTYHQESDEIFIEKLKNQNNLINSYIFLNSTMSGDVLPEEYIKVFDSKTDINIEENTTDSHLYSYRAVINLPMRFLYNVKNLSASVIPEDDDEIVRNYMPVVKFNNKYYPSSALSAYSMFTGIKSFVLTDKYLCSDDDCKTLKMPVEFTSSKDYIGNTVNGVFSTYRWYKPYENFYTHKTYSAIDLLVSYYAIKNKNEPKISPDEFKNKIVVVGLNADKNVWDRLSETPVLKKQADIDVHATMISNMLKNEFVSKADIKSVIFITLIFCFFILRGFKNLKNNLIYTSAFVLIYLLFYLFKNITGSYVPPLSPIVAMYLTAFFKNIYRFLVNDKYSEMIKRAMGKYVSKDVMKKVVSNLDKLNVGGERKIVTILFVDIRNFTNIAESLPPQEVSQILNDYFSVVEPIIAKYDGIVNKYMGDGILAIFGDSVKSDNHAYNAVSCGIEILDKISELKEAFIKNGRPKIDIGIGINTGEVFVGNIGTESRLEYTVIGDNVNIAYRIEAYNQLLKTQFLISQYTYEAVKDCVDVIKLSNVTIKGKSQPIDIYEVLKLNKNE